MFRLEESDVFLMTDQQYPLSAMVMFHGPLLCDGPCWDRTSDLGIKSPSGTAASGFAELKLSANPHFFDRSWMKRAERHGDEWVLPVVLQRGGEYADENAPDPS